MKKFITSILAAVMVLAMSCTVFAAPSPATVGSVSTTGATVTGGGSVEVAATEAAAPTATEIKAAATSEAAKAVVESADAKVVGLVDITVTGATGKFDVTIKVAGVTKDTKLVVLHEVNGAWKEEASVCGDGTVTIKDLTSCSPFALIADSKTLAKADTTPSKGTSPATGEASGIYVAVLVALVAMTGVVYVSRRRRA